MIAGRVGLSPKEWEEMTPAAFHAYVEGYLEEQKAAAELQRRQNYNLAVMVRAAIGSKHMPKYNRLFPEKRKKQMSDEEMYQQVLALNAMLGGTVSGE